MTNDRRARLTATLRGDAVDRPAVNFYEIGGLKIDPTDPDPFNVYRDPSWQPLLDLAERETDLIRLRSAVRAHSHESWDRAGGGGRIRARHAVDVRDVGNRRLSHDAHRAEHCGSQAHVGHPTPARCRYVVDG